MSRILYVCFIFTVIYAGTSGDYTRCEKPDWFKCDNDKCISFVFECDGENDCGDNSDEKNCTGYTLPPPIPCSESQFKCKDNSCIPIEKFCDRVVDCLDESDEYKNCTNDKKCDTFRCNDGYCLRDEWVCDGLYDCVDRSDEWNCDVIAGDKDRRDAVNSGKCNALNDLFVCQNKRCISLKLACNGKDDCGDGSDENPADKCEQGNALCKKSHCNHNCRSTPSGEALCVCRRGYTLSKDNVTCIDVDECLNYQSCDHRCVNNAGGHSCACYEGYELQSDGRTCKAQGDALMVFPTANEIRGYTLNSRVLYPVMQGISGSVTAISLDANFVYYATYNAHNSAATIMKTFVDHRTARPSSVVTIGLKLVSALAVDWVTENIYFADEGAHRIGVCANNWPACTVLIDHLDHPTSLVLLESKGVMYWSEWCTIGTCTPHISMASMDGKNVTGFLKRDMAQPRSLVIDYPVNRLYWIDVVFNTIESVRLDGTDRVSVLRAVTYQPRALALFEDKLYWSEYNTSRIVSCHKYFETDWAIVNVDDPTTFNIQIYHSALKPQIANPCNGNPCDELCLLNDNKGFTCACTLDKELNADRKTCTGANGEEHLIIAAGNLFVRYYHTLLGTATSTGFVTMRKVTALAYDPITASIIASDQLMDSIFRFAMSTLKLDSVMPIKNEILGGLDFDYVGNNLYWTNKERNTIEVHSLDTMKKVVFVLEERVKNILVVPEEGVMFVVFGANSNYHINRMRMDGLGDSRVVVDSLNGPKISLCYDRISKRIFWADQSTGRIMSATIDGGEKQLLYSGIPEPMSIAIIGHRVFWTVHRSNRVYWFDRKEMVQEDIELEISHEIDVLLLVSSHKYNASTKHPCRENNGNCSGVCLVSTSDQRRCACPPGEILDADNRTCTAQTTCGAGTFRCGQRNMCIPSEQRCDGVVNCPEGEDELQICGGHRHCNSLEYTCDNGDCIDASKRCNSYYDCTDRSDERDCAKTSCRADEYKCSEGKCIWTYLLCNGEYDCEDFSDEKNCVNHTCPPNSFRCGTHVCIPETWECDGYADCEDGSDEGERCDSHLCVPNTFKCSDDRCIDIALVCNGNDDCGDNLDERDCQKVFTYKPDMCAQNEWWCYGTSICLDIKERCNGVSTCPKGDDEHGCMKCSPDEFTCKNGKCVLHALVCDTRDDCGDMSDERNCRRNRTMVVPDTPVACEEFRCNVGGCLPFSRVCDGFVDCIDGTDESGECESACTTNSPCQKICYKTPTGPVCRCPYGYRLDQDQKSCVDIDECKSDVCSQLCRNTDGWFVCSCYDGFSLHHDWTTCKESGPRMEIIAAAKDKIVSLLPESKTRVQVIEQQPNLHITGLDADARNYTIYWSDVSRGTITKMNIKTKEQQVAHNVGRPDVLAVDWIAGNIFFFNNNRPPTIKVCNIGERKYAEIFYVEESNDVTSIAVAPKHGWLFWSQVSGQTIINRSSAIYRSNMTGENATAIVSAKASIISGIAIDQLRSRLYWSDSLQHVIESSDLHGGDRRVFKAKGRSLLTVYQPMNINIHGDSIYWAMNVINGILRKCDLRGEDACTDYFFDPSDIQKLFTIMHVSRQPHEANHCEDHRCDYMCVLEENGYACICSDGSTIEPEAACPDSPGSKTQSTTAEYDSKNRKQGNPTAIIVILVLATILILSGYCYYHQRRPKSLKKYDLSIHFQNPSYGQRNEIMMSHGGTFTPRIVPGEHEYINPIVNISAKIQEQEKRANNIIDVMYSDHSDAETVEVKQNARLIR